MTKNQRQRLAELLTDMAKVMLLYAEEMVKDSPDELKINSFESQFVVAQVQLAAIRNTQHRHISDISVPITLQQQNYTPEQVRSLMEQLNAK